MIESIVTCHTKEKVYPSRGIKGLEEPNPNPNNWVTKTNGLCHYSWESFSPLG
jgi:hypothetical protein